MTTKSTKWYKQQFAQLQPICINMVHINGHCDTCNPKWPLSISTTLNIDCNKHANQHAQDHTLLVTASNPLLDHNYPHVWIDQKIIYHHPILHYITQCCYQSQLIYLPSGKFQWELAQLHNINLVYIKPYTGQQSHHKQVHSWMTTTRNTVSCQESLYSPTLPIMQTTWKLQNTFVIPSSQLATIMDWSAK